MIKLDAVATRRSWRPGMAPATAPPPALLLLAGPRRRRRLAPPPRSSSSAAPPLLSLELPALTARLEVSALDPSAPDAEADAVAAAVLITRAFAGTAEEVRLADAQLFARRLLEVSRAAANAAAAAAAENAGPPRPRPALLLLARLHRVEEEKGGGGTGAAAAAAAEAVAMPPGRSSRVAGVACLSLEAHDGCRAEMVPCAEGLRSPPDDEPYLFNVAVDPKLRRRGVATALVRAAERQAAAVAAALDEDGGLEEEEEEQGGEGDTTARAARRPRGSVWLHVRQADPAAQALYGRAGYVEAGRDAAAALPSKVVVGLLGWLGGGGKESAASALPPPRPRILMKREL